MRFSALIISLSIVSGSAFAGQIQIGGVNGLSSSYIASGCSTNVVGQTCAAGSTGGFVEQNYDARLFNGATLSGTPPTPYTGYSTVAARAGTLTDTSNPGGNGNIAYSMINDGTTSGDSNNFRDAVNTLGTGTTLVVPIGVYAVNEVGTVIGNVWGMAGITDTQITFDFGSNNAHTVTSSLVLNLINAGASGSMASGQVGTAVDCTSQTTSNKPCLTYAAGPLAGTSTVNGITVETDTLYSSSYDAALGKYLDSAGSLFLEDQVFQLGAYSNQYLVDIQVKDLNGAAPANSATPSQTALSAITIMTAPEPSTVLLTLIGFGALGLGRLRRRNS